VYWLKIASSHIAPLLVNGWTFLVIWLFGSFGLLDFTYLQTQFLRSNRLLKI
jgi:hypothetical protein